MSIGKQVHQRVGKAFGLEQGRIFHASACPYYRVTWADNDVRRGIDGARTVFQLPRKAVLQAGKVELFRLLESKITREPFPESVKYLRLVQMNALCLFR